MPTTYYLLAQAERIELTCAAVYAALAVQFSRDPSARTLFERLAAEELQHASRIRLFSGRYRHDAKLLAQKPAQHSELDGLLEEAQRILADVRAGRFEPDLARAKRTLCALEDRFARAHAEVLARDGHPDLRLFFEQLARQDAAHAQLLVES